MENTTQKDRDSQGAQFEDMTLPDKFAFIQKIVYYPAISASLFLRSRIGARMLKPTRLGGLALFLIVIASLSSNAPGLGAPAASDHKGPGWLILFAVVMFGMGMYQRWHRKRDFRRSILWPSYHGGIPHLARILPFPLPIIYRYGDPAATLLMAWVAAHFSTLLGAWLMLSAMSIAIYEEARIELREEKEWDIQDAMFEAQLQSDVFEHLQGADEVDGPVMDLPPVPTGLGQDVARLMKRRTTLIVREGSATVAVQQSGA
jgi:hypothetical protein